MAPEWVVDRYRHWTTDAYVVSFPKSGRTWFRTMLGSALQLQFGTRAVDPTSVHLMWMFDPNVPRLLFTHDVNAHLNHVDDIEWDGHRYRNKKTILLVRDPRDTIVSLYFEMTKRVRAYDGPIDVFIRQDAGGIASLVAFLNSWMRNLHQIRHSLLLTYEDLHARPHETVRAALEFVGASEVSDENIAEAIRLSSFEAMRRMERAGDVQHVRLRPGDVADPQSYKVRSGKVGGYREALSPEDCAFLDAYIKRHLDPALARYRQAAPAL
ncbi:MAG: sulfotransferase domain-containing protein [Sphingobium sp.]